MRRTPKYFDGIENPAKRIDQLLPEWMQHLNKRVQDPREAIFSEWFLLIGPKMAPFTEPLSFEEGVLTVRVKSSVLYSLLSQQEKGTLLRQLQDKFSIKDLLFRIG
ncbi:MAG: DUF721 domain-containing protein [Verrucomicrobiota bacterium]|nr:DUF721 domain-containing protein [Verrucomicrobiota bacterium]